MLTNTLNTNEIKDAAGAEIEFTRLSIGDRSTIFAAVGEVPYAPYRMTIKHTESGSGFTRRRRSVVRFDRMVTGQITDSGMSSDSCYIVLDTQIGNHTDSAAATKILANLLSFCASLGASTTILYDGTGNGAVCLLTGGI